MARRIYDDDYSNEEFIRSFYDKTISWLKERFCPNPKGFSSHNDNVSVQKVKASIDSYFKDQDDIFISDIVHHAHNIGNNNAFEVFEVDKEKGEHTFACYLNLVNDMYGGVYLSVLDAQKKRYGLQYHLHYYSGARVSTD